MNKLDRDKYCLIMAEIEKRLEVIEDLYYERHSTTYDVTTIESICLQIRKVLELIAFSSLISHKESYEKVRDDIRKDWHADRILRKVESLNDYYYPVALKDTKYHDRSFKRGGFLTRKQFAFLYDKCGKILHARNPFNRYDKPLAFHRKVPEYVARIKELLTIHCITFIGSNEVIFVEVPFRKKSEPIRVHYGEFK